MQRNTINTVAPRPELKFGEEIFKRETTLELVTHPKYRGGGLYRINTTPAMSLRERDQVYTVLSRLAANFCDGKEFFIIDKKLHFCPPFLQVWNDYIELFYPKKSSRKAKERSALESVFVPSDIVEGFYQCVLTTSTIENIATNFVVWASHCFHMPNARQKKFHDTESFKRRLVANTDQFNFVFFHAAMHSCILISKTTYEAWAHACKEFSDMKSASIYLKELKIRKEKGEDLTLGELQIQLYPKIREALQENYWPNFIANLPHHPTTPVQLPETENKDFLRSLFIKRLDEDPNWFQMQVPRERIVEICIKMKKQAHMHDNRFSCDAMELTAKINLQKLIKAFNPNYDGELILHLDCFSGRIIASRKTAEIYNEIVWRIVNPTPVAQTRTRAHTEIEEDQDVISAPSRRRRIESPEPSERATVLPSTPMSSSPMILFPLPKNNNAEYRMTSSLKHFSREMQSYLRKQIYSPSAKSQLINASLTVSQKSLLPIDAVTRELANIPVKVNNMIYDFLTILDALENNNNRPLDIPSFKYTDVQPANEEYKNLQQVLTEIEHYRLQADRLA